MNGEGVILKVGEYRSRLRVRVLPGAAGEDVILAIDVLTTLGRSMRGLDKPMRLMDGVELSITAMYADGALVELPPIAGRPLNGQTEEGGGA